MGDVDVRAATFGPMRRRLLGLFTFSNSRRGLLRIGRILAGCFSRGLSGHLGRL